MQKDKIWLSSPHMGGNELKHIHEAFDTNWISTVGPQINEFEKVLKEFTGVKDSAVLGSGTAAIHLALQLMGVGPGDYVLCQSFTFAASANPITYLGATPVFIDSEYDTWNMDPQALEEAIISIRNSELPGSNAQVANSKSQIKAIIPVHLYGTPANMPAILAVANKYNIPVIEDAAEALGSHINGKMCGSFGEMGILSFNGNKIITTSGGGALLSNNTAYIEKAKFLATQARDPAPHYEHTQIGYNYRMGNINAAIGLGQMEVLPQRIARRREIWNIYFQEFKNIFEFQTSPPSEAPSEARSAGGPSSKTTHKALSEAKSVGGPSSQTTHNTPSEARSATFYSNRWLTTILTNSFETREQIRLSLEKENIESRPLWKPMHLQPVFKSAPYYGGNTSEDLFNRGLCLPSGSNMSDNQVERVISAIKEMK